MRNERQTFNIRGKQYRAEVQIPDLPARRRMDHAIGPSQADILHSRFVTEEEGSWVVKGAIVVGGIVAAGLTTNAIIDAMATRGPAPIEKTSDTGNPPTSPTATGTPDVQHPTPTQPLPSASGRSVEQQQSQDIPLVVFKSQQDAADRFGVPDTYSALASSWDVSKENGTVAILKPNLGDNPGYPLDNPNFHWGMESRVRPNGAVIQFDDKIKRDKTGIEQQTQTTANGQTITITNNAQAQAFVLNPINLPETIVLANEASFRVPQNPNDTEALSRKLETDQKNLETQKQPNTPTLPVNECPQALPGSYTLGTFNSAQTVAARFGGDTYTQDPSHWVPFDEPNGDKGAKLLPDESDPQKWGIEHLIRTNGGVWQAYDKVKTTPSGKEKQIQGDTVTEAQAQSFVVHPNVDQFYAERATVRITVSGSVQDNDALWRDSETGQRNAETQKQPYTPTLPINECIVPGKSSSVPSPTPGGFGPKGPFPSPTPTEGSEQPPIPTATPSYLMQGRAQEGK